VAFREAAGGPYASLLFIRRRKMSGRSVRAAIAVLLLVLVIALSVQSATTVLSNLESTPAIMVEEHGTTGS
jgi:hypothetical protein